MPKVPPPPCCQKDREKSSPKTSGASVLRGLHLSLLGDFSNFPIRICLVGRLRCSPPNIGVFGIYFACLAGNTGSPFSSKSWFVDSASSEVGSDADLSG